MKSKKKAPAAEASPNLKISNPDKVFWPDEG